MPLVERYWLDDKSAPFGTLLRYLQTYYSPEFYDDNFEELVSRARTADPQDTGFVTFKSELARVLMGDREGLHPKAIFTAAEYDEWGTDEEFLTWLWRELFPTEDVPASSAGERT